MHAIINQSKPDKMLFVNVLLLITATLTGLNAGLLYAYACSVNLGLSQLPDKEYLAAMQSINKEILNPIFFMGFFGALILLPVSSFATYSQPVSFRFIFLIVATLVYATGTFGVTAFGNVPLNNVLAKINLQSASSVEISRIRIDFESPWNRLHNIRTVTSIISLVFVILACLSKGDTIGK